MMLKRCLLLLKLLETGECSYSKCVDEFINAGIVIRKNRKIVVGDVDYLKKFFNKHCKDIVEKYNFLKSENIHPKDIESLEKAYKLYKYLEKHEPENRDLRHISTVVFGNSKTIQQSSLLRKIVDKYIKKSNKKAENYFNIIHLRSDNKVYFDNEDITNIMAKNNFFSCFSNKLSKIVTDAKYIVIFENLSPFFKLTPKNSLFIYAGGFQNISEVSRALQPFNDKQIIHFGDVDPSGLMIADILLFNNQAAVFYPDLDTIKSVSIMIENLLPAEKEYNASTLNSSILKEISEYMRNLGNYRIEQELITAFILQNKLRTPDWCSMK
ncbi:hypothetical protein FHQ18_12115 [Deferribacter autotrophicus]|uniref:Wadjet protein JetD C-terminal domain-containing protein n=1 Tax=Deferribacter autotrophicus TaxID=500465 RepID=A0A5A8EZR9_9BACT|nr:Wadjet anti-phage system protein JetD domain-containing protein [Deferribacter autotrophicus]KAA0256864.1 hypothetical protein FHQ18_12115 [Deferribacter autotrophicus]